MCALLWFGSGGFYHRIGKAIRVTSLVVIGDVEAWGQSLIAFNCNFMKFADNIPIVEEKNPIWPHWPNFSPPHWWQIIGRHWWFPTIIWNIDNAIYVILGVYTSWVSRLKWFDFWPLWSNFNLVVAEKRAAEMGGSRYLNWFSLYAVGVWRLGGDAVLRSLHYNDVIMSLMTSQITSLTTVYSSVYSGAYQRKHQSVTGRCEGNSPVTGEFPKQRASNAENVSIWWRHREMY